MLDYHDLSNLKNIKIKIFLLLLLFFVINSQISYSAETNRNIKNKQPTIQNDQYLKVHNSINQKTHSAHSAKKDSLQKMDFLNTMAETNSASAPWSNAFNFQKMAGTQIDPRTGTFAAYIKVGSLISNLDHGPNINLQINYNSNSKANPDGLGRGWSWNLTHFNPANNQLATSQGQNFSLIQDDLGHWWPRYHKLKDMRIDGDKEGNFVITYINGLREILNHDGYEVRLEQQDGKGVTFHYIQGTHLLSMITDDLGRKITLIRKNNYLTVTSYDSDGKPVNVRINHDSDELTSITLPGGKQQSKQGIYMHYSPFRHLLTQFVYPTGLTKSISYNCNQAMKMPLFYGINRQQALCVVTSQVVDPGMSQPKMITRYAYGQVSGNGHNYLGFNSGLSIIPGMSGDLLFAAPAEYTYKTSEDNGLTKIIRTYNKYHLMIDARLLDDKTGHMLTETHSFFCNANEYDGCAHTRFEDLPVTYTLPLETKTYTWGGSSGSPAVDITLQSYDNNGRLVSKTDTYGRRQTIKYCPPQGDASCPAEPPKWSLNALTESVTYYSSDKVSGASALPVIKIQNHYKKELNIDGSGYILVLDKQVLHSGHQQDTTLRQYYNDRTDYARYGLLKKLILTGKTPADKKPETLTREYHYIINSNHTTKTSYSVFETGSDLARRSSSATVSLFTHQTLQITDASGQNITRYHYDNQGRLIQADSAVGTAFAVSKRFNYTISPQLNQVVVTNPNGLQKKIIFDGAGRKLKNFAEMINAHGKAEYNQWRLVSRVTYDANGRIAAKHTYDYRKNLQNQPKQLTTTYAYTATGRILYKYLPDGEISVNRYDDPDRCVTSYTLDKKGDHSTISVVRGNILDKPIEHILLPASVDLPTAAGQYCTTGSQLAGAKITTVTYDANGRKISSTDPAGKTVTIHYNERGRVSEVINPIGDKVHSFYNLMGKVVQKWEEPAKESHQYLLFSVKYNIAGDPVWQAGEDGKRTLFTYTSDGKLATITTPAGNVITYRYNLLGLPVGKWLNGHSLLSIHYNPVTTSSDKITDNTGTTTWTYSDDGKMQQMVHHALNNVSDNYKITWTYDNNRNVIAMTNPSGQQTKTTYDSFGRIKSVSYQLKNGKQQLLSAPSYDGFSRIVAIKYGSGMERSIKYNSYGQKEYVTDMLSGKQLSAWQYTYDNEGNITTLVHSGNNQQQVILNYRYDKQDNLISVTCTGSAGLSLCPRDTHFKGSGVDKAPIITRQDYTFNPLNRMTQVKEVLTDATQQKTLNKVVSYGYGDIQAPLRLQQISTQWNNNPAVVKHFIYDVAGNMTTDGDGNHITYNAFNQITHVTTLDGKQSQYIYDGSGREVKQITNTDDIRYMFYTGKNLVGEQVDDLQQNKHVITPLGVAEAIDGVIHEYYEQNYKQDVTGILTKSDHGNNSWIMKQRNVYSPYGMQWHDHINNSQPLYLRSLEGFDGEQHDPVTGWQFLGAGHRTYNPGGRYFVSEDPVGDGYAFGSNNPIMHTDSSGNMPKWLGSAIHIMQYVATLGMAALHKRWASAIGMALMVTIGAIAAASGLAVLGAPTLAIEAVVGVLAVTGSVIVTTAAVPPNKGLSIASAVAGGIDVAVAVVCLGVAINSFVSSLSEAIAGLAGGFGDFTELTDVIGESGEAATEAGEAATEAGEAATEAGSATAEAGEAATAAEEADEASEAALNMPRALLISKKYTNDIIFQLNSTLSEHMQYTIDEKFLHIRNPLICTTTMEKMQHISGLKSQGSIDQLFEMLSWAEKTNKLINLNDLSEFLSLTENDFKTDATWMYNHIMDGQKTSNLESQVRSCQIRVLYFLNILKPVTKLF